LAILFTEEVKMSRLFKSVIVALAFIFIATNSRASDMLKNPVEVSDAQKNQLQQVIAKLVVDQDQAYPLSLPLIASAQLGDSAVYRTVLAEMQAALGKIANADAFKAWMLGRILFAANSIHDAATVKSVQNQLAPLLIDTRLDSLAPTSMDYAMYAWACGYYAGVSQENYAAIKQPMLTALRNLEGASSEAPHDHDRLSNAVWTAVMIAQAAANMGDRATYEDMLECIKVLTTQETVSQALSTALTRTDTSSDYPAWAMGIVRLAAVTLQDTALDRELTAPLQHAIRQAKDWGRVPNQLPLNQWKANSEAVLAELTGLLAQAKFKQTKS
jgi:hypothetical protein